MCSTLLPVISLPQEFVTNLLDELRDVEDDIVGYLVGTVDYTSSSGFPLIEILRIDTGYCEKAGEEEEEEVFPNEHRIDEVAIRFEFFIEPRKPSSDLLNVINQLPDDLDSQFKILCYSWRSGDSLVFNFYFPVVKNNIVIKNDPNEYDMSNTSGPSLENFPYAEFEETQDKQSVQAIFHGVENENDIGSYICINMIARLYPDRPIYATIGKKNLIINVKSTNQVKMYHSTIQTSGDAAFGCFGVISSKQSDDPAVQLQKFQAETTKISDITETFVSEIKSMKDEIHKEIKIEVSKILNGLMTQIQSTQIENNRASEKGGVPISRNLKSPILNTQQLHRRRSPIKTQTTKKNDDRSGPNSAKKSNTDNFLYYEEEEDKQTSTITQPQIFQRKRSQKQVTPQSVFHNKRSNFYYNEDESESEKKETPLTNRRKYTNYAEKNNSTTMDESYHTPNVKDFGSSNYAPLDDLTPIHSRDAGSKQGRTNNFIKNFEYEEDVEHSKQADSTGYQTSPNTSNKDTPNFFETKTSGTNRSNMGRISPRPIKERKSISTDESSVNTEMSVNTMKFLNVLQLDDRL